MYKYKNTSELDQVIPGLGVVKAGQEFQTKELLENPNFELLTDTVAPVEHATDNVNEQKETN